MKKQLLFSAFFVLGAAFAGCSDDEKPVDPVALAAPVLAEDAVTQVSVAVTWDAVENAASYACTLDGGAETSDNVGHDVDIGDERHVMHHRNPLTENRRRNELERRVLGTGYGNRTRKR